MNASFASALTAAREACAGQHYPAGALYVVATPIGNLADITLRALHVLQIADAIACEDTRHTAALLHGYGIDPAARLLAVHQHNEAQAGPEVIRRLQSGQRVALLSDAGTPAVSDPGARLVAAVREAGLAVTPVPGVSSVTALVSCAGVGSADPAGFVFAGFAPPRAAERQQALNLLWTSTRPVVLLEAPHRMESLARDIALLGSRTVTIGRELTKQFEEIATLQAGDVQDWLQAHPHRLKGEFVVLVHPPDCVRDDARADDEKLLRALLAELPLKTAVKVAATLSPTSRNALYERALGLKNSGAGQA